MLRSIRRWVNTTTLQEVFGRLNIQVVIAMVRFDLSCRNSHGFVSSHHMTCLRNDLSDLSSLIRQLHCLLKPHVTATCDRSKGTTGRRDATLCTCIRSNKCIATSSKCIATRNKMKQEATSFLNYLETKPNLTLLKRPASQKIPLIAAWPPRL